MELMGHQFTWERGRVKDGWNENNMASVQQKVKAYSDRLSVWGKEITGNFRRRIKECKESLKQLRGNSDRGSVERYDAVKKQLASILNQREIFWHQRSKQLWLQAGDQNSRFFYKLASNRRRNNQIHNLKDTYENWVDWEFGLDTLMERYFNDLFRATESDWKEVIECIPTIITDAQNVKFLKPIEEEEVKRALFQMNPDKAPGPDGMTPAFFQNYWKIVGKDIVDMVRNFSVMVVSNRLKETLDSVVSENQSAFMSGRLIYDNVMVSYEVMHYLKRKRRGRESHMALKLDMSKAYARIKWAYLKATEEEAMHVLRLLQSFERGSGQKLYRLLHMEEAGEGGTYLGLPNMMNRSKVATLGFLKDRVKNRVLSWDEKLFSQGGKEVIVKSIIQSLPSYAMRVFLLPMKITKDLEWLISKF
ncbi:uncharacterized protein LOC141680816 [Apium graveolens]|uniref:uncharacterized protein LOC141680816 n=1 Tax=Apium graveolens TaxID=4045 RepID=UPI003D79FB02